ncbi:hypothetical protein MPSEU_000413700 [Mayamaea pseudoterrestris]|nr:hypothetical protein MPSEU_000413700 [Mayamaea pseudoterrestris]
MRNSGSASDRAKPQSKLASLSKLKTDGLSNEDLFHNSTQSFDFSAVDFDPSAFAAAKQQNASTTSRHKQLLHANNDFDDYNDEQDADSMSTDDSQGVAASGNGDRTTKATSTSDMQIDCHDDSEGDSPRHSLSSRGNSPSSKGLDPESLGLETLSMDFFGNNNAFKFDASGIDETNGWLEGKDKASSAKPSANARQIPIQSNLRRPTNLPAAGGKIQPLQKRFEKPVTTRQQRQKSVGSALLVPGAAAKGISRQQRQRSVGPQLLGINSTLGNGTMPDGDQSVSATSSSTAGLLAGNSSDAIAKARNPRLARKRQESFRKPSSSLADAPKTESTSTNVFSAAGSTTDVHEKIEMNKSNRGGRSIFQRARQKINDNDDSNGNDDSGGGINNKASGVFGAIFKHSSADGEGDDAANKSPSQRKRLNPRNFFNRNKHAFMDSDDVSAASKSSKGGASGSEESGAENSRSTTEGSDAEEPVTAENKVLALIRQKEREKMREETGVPSFLTDDDESSELPSTRAGTAEGKVLAMIKAKENNTRSVDSDLRAELLAEDDVRNSPGLRPASTENKVLQMIKAKQRGSASVDASLRAELLNEDAPANNVTPVRSENKVLALIKAKEKEMERSRHARSPKSESPHKKDTDTETSAHQRRSNRRDEARKSTGNHRSSHRSSSSDKHSDERKSSGSHRSSHRSSSSDKHADDSKAANSSSHRRRTSRRGDEEKKSIHGRPEANVLLARIKAKDGKEKELIGESSSHRRRSYGHEGGGDKVEDDKQTQRSLRQKHEESPSTNSDKREHLEHGRRRLSGERNSEHVRRRSSGRSVEDPEVLAQIKCKVKESLTAAGHVRNHSERSPRDNLGSTWHNSPKDSRGVNRSLSSTDHRPSKGRVRKIRVSVSEMNGSRQELHSARKGSGSHASSSEEANGPAGTESRRRRSRSTVDK